MKLIFVYNAKSGSLNMLLDAAHKMVQPETYSCDLCALTHGVIGEKAAWKAFRENSNAEMEFLHSDEFESKYQTSFEYPVVLKSGSPLEILVPAEKFADFPSVDSLISHLTEVISASLR